MRMVAFPLEVENKSFASACPAYFADTLASVFVVHPSQNYREMMRLSVAVAVPDGDAVTKLTIVEMQ